jgi:alpha-beta hydrolase superfamily lysophospholipase
MPTRSERFSRPGQPTLRVLLFEPKVPPRAGVFITTGFSEHIGRYEHVAAAWAEAGFLVAVYDLRGHGQSGGRRAHVDHFSDYTNDACALLDHLAQQEEWRSLGKPIVFGHSLGGLITTLVALERPDRLLAVALSSPYYEQALRVPAWKTALGRLVSSFWPTYSDTTGITGIMLTHDEERARLIDRDPHRLGKVTARWFTEVEVAQEKVRHRAPELRLPVFCLAAGEDVIAKTETTRRIFDRFSSEEKELSVLEGERHELHQEKNRDAHIAAFAERLAEWAARYGVSPN